MDDFILDDISFGKVGRIPSTYERKTTGISRNGIASLDEVLRVFHGCIRIAVGNVLVVAIDITSVLVSKSIPDVGKIDLIHILGLDAVSSRLHVMD